MPASPGSGWPARLRSTAPRSLSLMLAFLSLRIALPNTRASHGSGSRSANPFPGAVLSRGLVFATGFPVVPDALSFEGEVPGFGEPPGRPVAALTIFDDLSSDGLEEPEAVSIRLIEESVPDTLPRLIAVDLSG